MRISAKVDYAVRAAVQLAAVDGDRPTKGDAIAQAQGIPVKFLENILGDLRHAGLVRSQRGADGGYWLNRPRTRSRRRHHPRRRGAARVGARPAAGGHRVRGAGRAALEGLDRRAREPARGRRAGDAGRHRDGRAAGRTSTRSRATPRRGSPADVAD